MLVATVYDKYLDYCNKRLEAIEKDSEKNESDDKKVKPCKTKGLLNI